MVINFVRCGR